MFRFQSGLYDLIRPVYEKDYFAAFGEQDDEKNKKPCLSSKCPLLLDLSSLWERIITPYLASKTPKSPKIRIQMQNGPVDLIRLVCEKELFRCIWPSGPEWDIRLNSRSLWERIISLNLARTTPKSPKSRVQVQNGPLDLIRPVYEKDYFAAFGEQYCEKTKSRV